MGARHCLKPIRHLLSSQIVFQGRPGESGERGEDGKPGEKVSIKSSKVFVFSLSEENFPPYDSFNPLVP